MDVDISAWFAEHGVTEVEALMPDMAGVPRGKIMPAQKYCEDLGMRLPEAIILQTVTGDYPSDWSAVRPNDGDMLLRGDLSSVRLVPWATEPTAQVIHDCFYDDGSVVRTAPRQVLQHVLGLYAARGWRPVVAPELEFYLVKQNPDADYPLEPPVGRSGRPEAGRQSYGIDALNEYDPLVEEIYDFCEAQEIELDTLIHESGSAQLEMNLIHGDPLALADQAFMFKRTVRQTALRHDMYATFMAKPMQREPGSAMHLHQSVVDVDSGENVFSAGGEPSKLFFAHIAGLQRYLPAAMPLLAPNVNSYRRFTRYLAAPINLQWGFDNRTTGLRVPHSGAADMRVENRVAGADANPYLAIAASLACGYLGMVEALEPTDPLAGNAYEDAAFDLPRSLEESLRTLATCEPLVELLGQPFARAYMAVKTCESEAFSHVISSWEREFLLLTV